MRKQLTQKQENFANFYLEECGDASKAYRRAYDAGGMKAATINNKAYGLLKRDDIRARVSELRQELKERSDLKKEEVLRLLTDVIRGADVIDVKRSNGDMTTVQTIARTWAIERACKLLGYDAPTQSEVTGRMSVGRPVEQMTDEERRAEIRRIYESLNR